MPGRSSTKKASERKHVCGFSKVKPRQAGLCKAPLDQLKAATLHDVHREGSVAGVAHIIIRGGRCVFAQTAGWANRKKGKRFGLRTICRLHGATKPLVVAAFFTLVDEGKVCLDDPVEKFISFSDRVASPAARMLVTRARTKPTVRHLLTMTAGLQYQDCPSYKGLMAAVANGRVSDLKGLCDGLARVPLQLQPGAKHDYGFCTDVLGRVCEVVSGQSLDQFVEERLLLPLGMKDTHFRLPSSKRSRASMLYSCHDASPSKRVRLGKTKTTKPVIETGPQAPSTLLSAGGGVLSYKEPGMWSTPADYVRFCQMLLNGGLAPSGQRILKAATVRSFWQDSLAAYTRKDGTVAGWSDFSPNDPEETAFWDQHTWTLLNTTVELPKPRSQRIAGPTQRGQCMWMYGGSGTGWVVDAERDMIALSFAQTFGGAFWERANGTGCYCMNFARAAVDEAVR